MLAVMSKKSKATEKMSWLEVFFWVLFSLLMLLTIAGNIHMEYKMTPAEREEYNKLPIVW